MVRTIILIVLTCLGLFQQTGCTRPDQRVNFDHLAWKEDKSGCLGKRSDIYPSLMENKESLLKLNEKQLVRILGLPDINELSKRNQKFFVYAIFPGEKCNSRSGEELYLVIRFNAVGLSSEIFVLDTPGPL